MIHPHPTRCQNDYGLRIPRYLTLYSAPENAAPKSCTSDFKQALCVAAPASVPQQASIAFSGSRQHSAKHREVHIATGEDQADTFPLHAVALLEQCR